MSSIISNAFNEQRVVELIYHGFWKNQEVPSIYQSDCGKKIIVDFCGWYNRSAGPDFLSAKLIVDGTAITGDIEIHCDEDDWFAHKHSNNPNYDRVILHAYVRSGKRKAVDSENRVILGLKLDYHQAGQQNIEETRKLLLNTEGACGLMLRSSNHRDFLKILSKAAEARLSRKAEQIQPLLQTNSDEEVLYQQIFRAFGLKKHGTIFLKISEVFPYSHFLRTSLKNEFHDATRTITNEWKEQYFNISQKSGLESLSFHKDKETGEYSPQQMKFTGTIYDNVERALALFFQHLWATREKGLLATWAKQIMSFGEQPLDTLTGAKLIKFFQVLFQNDLQDASSTLNKNIGTQKIVIVMANAILPFFMAWAEENNRQDMTHILFNMFTLMPGEKENSKIAFMKKRLSMGSLGIKQGNTMKISQGLIQIHDDCCRHFHDGCDNCRLVDWLTPKS